jgi:hypothetical protein
VNEETLDVPPVPDGPPAWPADRPAEPAGVRAVWDRMLTADGGCGGRGLQR